MLPLRLTEACPETNSQGPTCRAGVNGSPLPDVVALNHPAATPNSLGSSVGPCD